MAKLKRKELLKKEDAFLSAASQGAKWAGAHRWQVLGGATAAVVAIIAIWGAVEFMRTRDAKASLLFERGLEILDGEVLPADSEEAPNPEGDPPTFADDNAKWQAARDQLQKVVDETGTSGVATLARLLIADLQEKLGNAKLAENAFEDLASRLSASDSLSYLAIERAAYLKEARGDTEGALRLLSRLVNVEQGFYSDHAIYHQARLYLATGETDRARNLLERIEKDFPNSSIMQQVRDRLAELPPRRPQGSEDADAGEQVEAAGAGANSAPVAASQEPPSQ